MKTFNRPMFYTAAITVALAVLLQIAKAHAEGPESHADGHAKLHDFYREWSRPDTGGSCCNMRVTTPDGGYTGDCRATPFRPAVDKDGKFDHWQALLDDGRSWVDVPDSKIIREKNPDPSGQDGHLCENLGIVYCAVPPTGGT